MADSPSLSWAGAGLGALLVLGGTGAAVAVFRNMMRVPSGRSRRSAALAGPTDPHQPRSAVRPDRDGPPSWGKAFGLVTVPLLLAASAFAYLWLANPRQPAARPAPPTASAPAPSPTVLTAKATATVSPCIRGTYAVDVKVEVAGGPIVKAELHVLAADGQEYVLTMRVKENTAAHPVEIRGNATWWVTVESSEDRKTATERRGVTSPC